MVGTLLLPEPQNVRVIARRTVGSLHKGSSLASTWTPCARMAPAYQALVKRSSFIRFGLPAGTHVAVTDPPSLRWARSRQIGEARHGGRATDSAARRDARDARRLPDRRLRLGK